MLTFDTFYPSDIHITDKTLLLNIETTGLSPRSAFVFMIGLGWPERDGWHFRCLLAEKRMDERMLMQSFQDTLKSFNQVLTYGGHSFTYRFLNERWKNYADSAVFSDIEETTDFLFRNIRQLDIQKDIAPYRQLLAMTDTKKHTAEQFICYNRNEHLAPKELIHCYTQWELSGDSALLTQLTTHHETDMAGLLKLYSLSSYSRFFRGEFETLTHYALKGDFCHFNLSLKLPVPKPVKTTFENISLSLEYTSAKLVVPVIDTELKYFLPGPVKDYYYLPQEDQAVHRSVACYVDKAYRQKATAATCYIRQRGLFLPAFDQTLQPCFKKAYNEENYYIPYDTEKFDAEPDYLKRYLTALIKSSSAQLSHSSRQK